MQKDYFKNKSVLITGITGFVGSRLVEKLSALGADIYGISRSVEKKNIVKGSILDYICVDSVIKDRRIDICFHLAGETLVEAGQNNPYHVFKTNMQGTLNILESTRKNGVKKVIIASTSHVYGRNRVPYFEGYTPRPSRPYETSKACTDLIAQSYADTFDLPVMIPRFVNIYGPGDINFYRLIPKTIKSILSDTPPNMWGGDAVRDYLYIDDAIDGYIKLAKTNLVKIKGNRIFNFGTGNIISVKDLINKIITLSKKQLTIHTVHDERSAEIKSQYVSWNKAKKILGWKPKISLDEGLKESVNWYKNYFSNNSLQ